MDFWERCEGLFCDNTSCTMRKNDRSVDRVRKYRFAKELDKRIGNREKCRFCDHIVQTLHHIDENHSNNRTSNLLNVCHSCHLNIEHKIDSLPADVSLNPFNPKSPKKGVKTALHPHKSDIVLPENCNAPFEYREMLDFIEQNGDRDRFNFYIAKHKKGVSWKIVTCSRKTLQILLKKGFDKIRRIW